MTIPGKENRATGKIDGEWVNCGRRVPFLLSSKNAKAHASTTTKKDLFPSMGEKKRKTDIFLILIFAIFGITLSSNVGRTYIGVS